MNKHKPKFYSLLLLTVFLFGMMNTVSLVTASEEEETDQFVNMPNYRWQNETTSESQEQLIGDNYEVYNYNNETSGTSDFAKSRDLNSRDFYFESQFGLDIGGNETEYFRDRLGDAADFEEDNDGFIAYNVPSLDIENGIASYEVDAQWDGILNDFNIYSSFESFIGIEVRIKTENDVTLRFGINTDGNDYQRYWDELIIGGNWIVLDLDESDLIGVDNVRIFDEIRIQVYGSVSSAFNIYIDYYYLKFDLDYATHVESEIEDTWDWEDSDEYFYDEENNISDFNDGSYEQWDIFDGGSSYDITDGWLHVETGAGGSGQEDIQFECTGMNIDSSVYKWFTMEWYTVGSDGPNSIVILDDDDNQLYADLSPTWVSGTRYLLSVNLDDDADWSGTEVGIEIEFPSIFSGDTYFNFTFLYDVELGDRESFTGYDSDTNAYTYVNPQGYLVGHKRAATDGWGAFRISGVSIDSNIFTSLVFRMKVSSGTVNVSIYDQQLNYFVTAGLTSSWQIFTIDLTLESEWTGTETGFVWRASGVSLVDFYMDYVLLLGEWEGQYKFSLLNQDSEEGMNFEFTQTEVTTSTYNFTIDVFDSVGIALTYSNSFVYDFNSDGWLYLEVEMDLDERQASVTLDYENGTRIIKKRTWYSIFGYTGISNFLITDDGSPALCLNNSQVSMGRSWIIINYIDANYRLDVFIEPDVGTVHSFNGMGFIQNESNLFDAESEYGINLDRKALDNGTRFYYQDIDRFDALSFDITIDMIDTDANDMAKFYYELFNVQPDGSLVKVLEVLVYGTDGTASVVKIYNDTTQLGYSASGALNEPNVECAITTIRNEEGEIILGLDINHVTTSKTEERVYAFSDSNYDYTSEFVFYFGYNVRNIFGTDTDDIVSISVSRLDTVRKDWLGDVFGGIVRAFGELLSFIFSPIIIVLMFVLSEIGKGFKWLAEALEPFFDNLIDAFTSWLSTIVDDLGDLISDLGSIAGWIGDYLVTLIGDFIDDAITWLGNVSQDVIDVLGIIFYVFYDGFFVVVLGASEAPDFIAIIGTFVGPLITIIAGTPQFIIDVLSWIFVGGLLFLLFFWLWALFLGFARERFDPLAGLSEFLERMTRGPDITIIGVGPFRFCIGWFMMLPLTMFLIVAPTNPFFWIW